MKLNRTMWKLIMLALALLAIFGMAAYADDAAGVPTVTANSWSGLEASLLGVATLVLTMIVGRFIQALRSGQGIKGAFLAVWLGTNGPAAKLVIIGLSLAGVMLAGTGCAAFGKKSESSHEIKKYAAALPPGWSLVYPVGNGTEPGSQATAQAVFAATGTNAPDGLFAARPRIFLAYREIWDDTSKGGGHFLFTDPAASQVSSAVSNQTALGGSHTFGVGNVSSTITSNAVSAIAAGGTAVGNIAGALVKTAAKP